MELSRRRFMQFLSAAPVALAAFDSHRVIFDMGRSKLWTPKDYYQSVIIPVEMGDYIDLGSYFDRAIANQLRLFGEEYKPETYNVNRRFEVPIRLANADSPVQIYHGTSRLPRIG